MALIASIPFIIGEGWSSVTITLIFSRLTTLTSMLQAGSLAAWPEDGFRTEM
jgi:hypothetical protein